MNKVLARQLKKLGLSEDILPTSMDAWHGLLKNIDNLYSESDSDRYRLERSMDISSSEMQELNSKLQDAQDMAGLGYWSLNVLTMEGTWSLKLFEIFGVDLSKQIPTFEDILKQTHTDDTALLRNSFDEAVDKAKSYNIQFRMHPFNNPNEYRWFQVICNASECIDGKCNKLSGIAMDITDRRNSELEIERLNSQLIDTARRAGMSEIATSMLHNIGNVLNSANATTEWIKQELGNVIYERITPLSDLLTQHKENMADFLEHDEAGKKVIEYIIALNQRIIQSNNKLKIETNSLLNHLHHISEITSAHKLTSGATGVTSIIKIESIIDEALAICAIDLKNNGIHLIKKIDKNITLNTDKHKIIQILINLIKNAIDSLVSCNTLPDKKIILDVINQTINDENKLMISVIDNGIGIETDTLKELFKFGFTTKKTGHGFGLHGSAINANELHAKITAESNGYMQGAKFTLIMKLPVTEGAL